MERSNQTSIYEFLLMGLSEQPEQQPLLFGLFLGMYLVTVLGNLLIILAISSDVHLHTPMYIFLANLSFSDIGFISTIIPKMLDLDNFLLAVMAFDRYVAISHPLHYAMTMNSQCCVLLMENTNWTSVSHFVLLGISSYPQEQIPLFLLFLFMYAINISGNFAIITLIISTPHLHTPMYIFLSNLALVDICFTSTTVPKMLQNIFSPTKIISYMGCLAQTYFFICFAAMENFLLAIMAYDRYIAICHPFRYHMILTRMLCSEMVALCHILSHLHALLHTFLMGQLIFCADNRIPHFFCDLYPLMKLSCSSTHLNTLMIHTEGVIVINGALAFIIASYACIISVVLRSPSAKGKWRAFSTCGSHLTVVAIFYGTLTWVYFQPITSYSVAKGRILTVMHTVVTPMMNPFIYSLRNGDVERAFRKWRSRSWISFFR
ncbi:hypothetical protein QTO34_005214 [Cnephaeus nilssonii]|uniref:G-protein coupled receptors family 1 profile domain-containing protein n=1 Tax=Cnephaeus nilssonii TaxID=3371016 RepID=A0AA40LJM4_CNENI|nr:hypothetical protein QTO34_005214 [Eptesicus nilssonii]